VEALGGKWCWGCFVCAVSPVCFCCSFLIIKNSDDIYILFV
jgi:hypothetical protein